MFCTSCGTTLADDAQFCSKCGRAQGGQAGATPTGSNMTLKWFLAVAAIITGTIILLQLPYSGYFWDHGPEAGLTFVSLRDNLDLSTPSGRLMFQIIGAMAEFERSLIQERVRAGLRNAKLKGKALGRPPLALDSGRIARLRASGASIRAYFSAARRIAFDDPQGPATAYAKPLVLAIAPARANN